MQLAQINPNVIVSALLGGILPTFAWLYFWLRQCKSHEPRGLIIMSFILGALALPFTIPLQHVLSDIFGAHDYFIFVAAGVEEVVKFILLRMLVLRDEFIDSPTDFTIYLIAAALGFAALENTLYLIKPLLDHNMTLALSTGNIRFLGSTVIHAASSALLGLWIGLGLFRNSYFLRFLGIIVGIASATALHGLFNYFIINDNKVIVVITLIATWIAMGIILFAIHEANEVATLPAPDNLQPTYE